MASAIAAFRPSIAVLVVFLLIASMALPNAEGACNLVEKASLTWSGNCGNTRHCDDQCKAWENAQHGACHVRNGKHMCFCYFCAAAATAKNKPATSTSANNKPATSTSADNKPATSTSAKNKP